MNIGGTLSTSLCPKWTSGVIRPWQRAQALEFDASVIGCEVPLGDGVSFVLFADPAGCLFVGDAPVETLRGEDAEFGFGKVQP
jgi:hypothetical protein